MTPTASESRQKAIRANSRLSSKQSATLHYGAKPAVLAVQEPTRVDFVVNLRAAKTEGHTISQSILLRADAVVR